MKIIHKLAKSGKPYTAIRAIGKDGRIITDFDIVKCHLALACADPLEVARLRESLHLAHNAELLSTPSEWYIEI